MDNKTTTSASNIVSKVWAFCNTLRDYGVGYGDYLEQLTYLLFLKMADEYSKPPYNHPTQIPGAYNWGTLTNKSGGDLNCITTPCCENWQRKKGFSARSSPRARIKYRTR